MKRIIGVLLAIALFFALTAALADESYSPLEYGSKGEEVERIQQQLAYLGYYSGKVSGNFLEGTRAAVTKFQKDYGIEETGAVDGETEAMLFNAEYRLLSYGMSGEDVRRVQEHLATLDYYNGKQSGDYLEGTTAAIKKFQEQNALTVTGDADPDTQRVLFSESALAKDEVRATPSPEEDLGDINDVVMVEDGVDSGDPTPTPLGYYQKLTRGSTGARVKQVQQRLTELGFFDGPISGNYMNQTVAAVKKFQEHNGMEADGVTGEETWNLLFDSAEVRSAEASPRPTPEPTPVPYAVTVDVQNQAVLVYGRDENGGYTVPVRRMVCSTGMKGSDSDVGEWVLNGRTARWAFFSLYGSHAQYWTRINSAIAFHSVIYRSVDNMALSVKSYNLLGSRASHGCIRLLVSDAKWIYDNLGEGTVVTITEDIPNDPELRSAIKPPALNRGNMLPYSTPEPTAEPAYSATALPPQPFRQLKRNSEGEDVYWLQRKLKDMGFYTGTATGVFLSGTEKAVKAFQKENGMSADGVAGEETLQAIYADVLHPVVTITPPRVSVSPSAAVTPSPTVAPLPSPSQKP